MACSRVLMIFSAVFTTLCRCLWSLTLVLPYHTVMQLVKTLSTIQVLKLLRILGDMPNFLSLLRKYSHCCAFLTSWVVLSVQDVDPELFKAAHPLYFKISDKEWLVSSLSSPQLGKVEGSREKCAKCSSEY